MITIYYLKGTKQGCTVFYSDDYHQELVEVLHKEMSSTKFLRLYAAFYHHSIEDGQKMIRKRYQFNQKIPVLIEKDRSLFFPTASKNQWDCCWINYYAVSQVHKRGNGCVIQFHELGKKYRFTVHDVLDIAIREHEFEEELALDARIIRKQLQRCRQIDEDLREENKENYLWL